MENYLKKYGTHSLIISVLLVILSIFLIFKPFESLNIVFILIGCVLAINGLVHAISYFSGPKEIQLFSFELIQGVAGIILGFLFILHPEWLSSFLPFVIGAWIIVESIIRFQISVNMRGIPNSRWMIMMILAILTVILGMFIMIYPAASSAILVTLCGIMLLVTEIIHIVEEVYLMIRMK